jgi:hypothetical protein
MKTLYNKNNVPNQQTDDFDPPTIIDRVKTLAVEKQNRRLEEKK